MKLVRPGCKRDAQPLDTNSANVVSWFLLVWPSFLVLWPSFWGVYGSRVLVVWLLLWGIWVTGLRQWVWAVLTGLGGPHSFPDENLDLIGPITVVRHVAFSLRRCGRTADTMICFSFSVRSQPRFFHTLSLLVLRVQTAETTRTTTSRREEFPRHGDEAPRQWKKPLAMPLHSRTARRTAPIKVVQLVLHGQKFVVLSSLARPRVRCTVPGRSQSTQNFGSKEAHVWLSVPDHPKPRPRPPKNHNPNTGL